MDFALPPGLTSRAIRPADLPAVHELVAAYERRVLGVALIDLEDLEVDFRRPGFDPDRDAVLVHDGDRLVGWGEVFLGRDATVCVHPDAWGRGVGTALVGWISARARETGSKRVGLTVPDQDPAGSALLSRRGWEPLWTSWVLEVPPGEEVAARAMPDGYSLRSFRPGADERAVYEVVEQAFSEWPDREAVSYEEWAVTTLGRPGFTPEHLLVAETTEGAVVGVCGLLLSGDAGWVDRLAVDRAHRRRGIAQSLLAAAFAIAREHGAVRNELSTDSRTGALTLYERLGMRVRWSFTRWAGDPAGTLVG